MSFRICSLGGALAAASSILVGSATALAADAPAPAAMIAAAPMHSKGGKPIYPRLTAFPSPAIMAKVNAALAKQEADDRDSRSDCIKSVLEANDKPDADTYQTDISVTYLSSRYLSVNVVSSYYCGGPYPTAGAEAPLTFDLTTGEPVDWKTIFKPGFLPPDDGEDSAHPSGLAKIYKARYRKSDPADDDCRSVIADPSWSFSPTLWLSAKEGFVVEPDFPHVVAACADDLSLSAADLAAYVKNAAFLTDLKATVRPGAPVKAKVSKAAAK
jgi:hypothetical protein